MPRTTTKTPTTRKFTLPSPLGNSPAPDHYLRIKQNLDGLASSVNDIIAALPSGLLTPAQIAQIQSSLQATGSNPLNLTSLPGTPGGVVTSINGLVGALSILAGAGVTVTIGLTTITVSLPSVGPGAGTYTVGFKLTGGGVNGTITLDAQGRVTAVQQAT